MEREMNDIVYEGVVVPESVMLKREKLPRYGTVPDLDEDELADPDELERQVIRGELEPVLLLPGQPRRSPISPNIDENGGVDWGAFGTVDFDRFGDFDKARYKAEKLREELKNLLLLMEISKEHVPGKAKYLVLKHIEREVIDIDHIVDVDMFILANQYLRAQRLQKEIAQLKKISWRRREAAAEAWLSS